MQIQLAPGQHKFCLEGWMLVARLSRIEGEIGTDLFLLLCSCDKKCSCDQRYSLCGDTRS